MGSGRFTRLAALASASALVASACGSAIITATPIATATVVPSAVATPSATATPAATRCVAPTFSPDVKSGGGLIEVNGTPHVVVRWFVGLGPGEDPAQIAVQQTVVNDFNALQDQRTDGVEPTLLSLEIVHSALAADILTSEIASCFMPDLIGPLDVATRTGLPGEFMDMTPLIAAAGLNLAQYPASLLDATKDGRTGSLLGLPYGVLPSVIFYNKDLFDQAGLKYPPQKAGDKYTMPNGTQVPWNWDTVRNIAMKLSLDANGRDATQAAFDATNQVQFGFEFQAAEDLGVASAFGSGSFLGADGRTAQFPDAWKAAWTWYNDGIWNDHFIASDTERNSVPPGAGDPVFSCCNWAGALAAGSKLKRWDIAVMPAGAQGMIAAPLEVETFAIDRNSLVAQRAFEAMTYIMSRPDLLAVYGVSPYTGDQLAFYRANADPHLAQLFPGNKVNWQVAIDMERFGDLQNQAADLPNFAAARADYSRAFATLATTHVLDLNKVFANVTAALQADFDAAR